MFDFSRFCLDHRIKTFTGRGERHHVREGWIGADCPICFKPHLAFNTVKGYAHCWSCGTIRITDLIQLVTKCSNDQAWEIRKKYDDAPQRKAIRVAARLRPREPQRPTGLDEVTQRHIAYLRDERGLSKPRAVIREWDLMGTTHLGGSWSWRVVAPIYNDQSQVVAYVGRSIADAKPKYRFTERDKCAEDPDGMLYGIHKAKGDAVIIVEGPGDVWNIGPGAVSTLSMEWRKKQANRLRKFKRRAVMFDPEPKAQQRARELAEWLSMFPGETEVIDGLPSDPGSLSNNMVRKLRKEFLE